MTTLSLRLPKSIHIKLAELATAEGVSLNQLLSSAAAEKLAALTTEEYLAERGKKSSRRKFDAVLKKVPSGQAVKGDEIPAGYSRDRRKRAG